MRKLIFKTLDRATKHLIIWSSARLPAAVFALVFNAIQSITGRKVRLLSRDGHWIVTEDNVHHTILEPSRAVIYREGLFKRCNFLAHQYFLQRVSLSEDDVIIDCGANIGDLALYFSKVAPSIRYIAYEPGPGEYSVLKKNFEHNNINGQLEPVALYSENTIKQFFVKSDTADSSLFDMGTYNSVLDVTCRRLDDCLPTDVNRIRVLKLEAEGGEPEVLLGAERTLEFTDYVAADLGPERGIDKEETAIPVINYLLKRQFEIVAMNSHRGCYLFSKVGVDPALKI